MRFRTLGAFALVACGAATNAPPQHAAPLTYAENVKWVCMPGAAFDACKTELTATAIMPDGTRKTSPHVAARDPKIDCFYVYPTVDLDLVPGNHDDFDDTRIQRQTTLAQVGRFTEACAVWAPLYRQVTFGTFLRSDERLERGLAIAFADVEAAFREYLARAPSDRKIVLVGHSQGGGMIVRLVKKFFDHDEAMRARLLLAMPIGADVDTLANQTTGGTFENVPVCSKPNEVGCVVAYRTYAAGAPVETVEKWNPPAGHATACVNPASIDGGPTSHEARFSHAYFFTGGGLRRFMHNVDGIETAYIDVPDFDSARCVAQPNGFRISK